MPRKYLAFTALVSAVLILLGIGIYQKSTSETLSINGHKFILERVTTAADQARGLSGRESIGQNDVMLFPFTEPAERCFWMKDMKFNIDMVWLDADMRVVAIEPNVSPDSYPQNFCHDNAQYVAEFAGNTTQKLNLKLGDKISL